MLPDLPDLGGRKRKKKTPAVSIDDSTLSSILAPAVAGVDMLGRVLDFPGRQARWALSGFSEDERDYSDGRGLLEHWGMLGRNTTGLDVGDVLGFGAEVALDPLLFLSGPGKALTSLGREAAEQSGKLLAKGATKSVGRSLGLNAGDIVQEITRGERGLLGFKLPGIMGVSDPIELGAIGTGPMAGKVADFLAYNPVTSLLKPFLSHHASKYGALPGLKSGMLRAADHAHSQELHALQEFRTLASDYMQRGDELKETINGFLGSSANTPDFDQLIRRTYELGNQTNLADELGKLAPGVPREQIIQAADKTKALFDELVAVKDQWHDAGIAIGLDWSKLQDDWIEHLPRRLGMAQRKALGEDIKAFRGVMEFARRDELRNIPGGTDVLNRLAKDVRFTDLTAKGPEIEAARLAAWGGNVPDRDGRVQALLSELTKHAGQVTPEQAEKLAESAGMLTDYLGGLKASRYTSLDPVTNQWSAGLFNRPVIDDLMDDVTQRIRAVHWMKGVREVLADSSIVGNSPEGLNLSDAWNLIGGGRLTDEGLDGLITENWDKFAKLAGIEGTQLGSKAPNGLDALAHVKQSVTVPQRVASSFNRTFKLATDPTAVGELVRGIDKFAAFFKGSQTLPWPGFWVRNGLSGAFQNWASGAWTKGGWDKSLDILKTGKYPEGLKSVLKAHAEDIYGHGPGKSAYDILEHMTDESFGLPTEASIASGRTGMRALFDTVNPLGGLPWRDTKAAGLKRQFNPLAMRGVGADATKRSEFILARLGENANGLVEWQNRTSAFLSLLEKGVSPAEAAREVKRLHFDYSELSDAERRWFKRVIPFFTWTKKNLGLQLGELINNPGGRTAQTIRALNYSRGRDDSEYTPQHVKAKGGLKLYDLDATTTRYLNVGTLLPVAAAFEDFERTGGGVLSDLHRAGQNLLADSMPWFNYPYEAMTGTDTFSGRKLNTLYQYPFGPDENALIQTKTGHPNLNNLLANMPYSRGLSTWRQFTDERKGPLEFLTNFLTGLKITDQDRQRGAEIDAHRVIDRQLESNPALRQFQTYYVPDGVEADSETLRQLALANALTQLGKKRKKEKR